MDGPKPYRFEPKKKAIPAVNVDEGENNPPDPDDRLGNVNWCSCGRCVPMPTQTESVCCREYPQVVSHLDSLQEQTQVQCITEHPGFADVCLSPWVLATAWHQFHDKRHNTAVSLHEKYRYVAYRQFVRWFWGVVGRRNRIPLCSCVVTAVREAFPNENGRYKGFLWPPLQ